MSRGLKSHVRFHIFFEVTTTSKVTIFENFVSVTIIELSEEFGVRIMQVNTLSEKNFFFLFTRFN